jgi:diguanylate cyclase (GGDEF)-like protein/PAS domain S-box-containing protein
MRLPFARLNIAVPALSVTGVGQLALIGLSWYLAALVSLSISPHMAQVALLWLPPGVALAALVRWGMGVWPGIFVSATTMFIVSGTSPFLALALGGCQTLGAIAATWGLKRLNFHPALEHRRDLWHFCLIGAVAASLIVSSAAVLCLAMFGAMAHTQLPAAWLYGWVGGAVGTLLLGVPLLTVSRDTLREALAGWRWLPTLMLSSAVLSSGLLVFGSTTAADPPLSPLIFVPPLLLSWLAVRSGTFASSLIALLLTCAAAFATTAGHGPFAEPAIAPSMAVLWVYACTLSATPLLLTALVGELRSKDERWQLALDHSRIGVAEWDVEAAEFTLSRHWLAMLGHQTQSFGRSFSAAWTRVHEEDQPALQDALASLRTGRDSARAEFRMQTNDGGWKWLEGHAIVAQRNALREPVRIIITARDIGDQRAAEERYQLSSKLFQHLHEGLLITDANHRVLDVNPTFSAITGYTREELLGVVAPLMRPAPTGSAAERQQIAMRDSLLATGSWRGEIVDKRRNGESCTMQVTVSAVKGQNGQIRFHALAIADVTQAHAQRAQLERQAHTDELTGLPNRARLAHLLRDAMLSSEREGFLLTICYLDLDHFKPVNDNHGHEAGDRLLIDLAERLRRSLRHWASGDDAVARLGGDEFVLLLRTATLEEGRHAVERVMRSVSQPYALGVAAGPVWVTASIGATVYPIDKADADTLLRHADHAMYGAKQAGRNGYLFFDAEHDRRTEQHFEALGRVQDALDANEFVLYYQPKVDMRQGRVLGVEALLRWKHPQHGVITPAQFLPLIEHTGLSARLGDWVLQEGIEQLAKWQRMGLDVTVSVNISARHLQEPLFSKRLAGLLGRHNTPVGQRLIIEVLETAALADVEYTCALMDECRELGVRFALDDFGTGYSTFTYLKRLPLDFLKIDRSFVHNMLIDRQDLAIVEGVIGLSETFGCKVVAEGVESKEQARRLIELGCDVGQGNGISEAMPVSEVYNWVRGFKNTISAPQWADTLQ